MSKVTTKVEVRVEIEGPLAATLLSHDTEANTLRAHADLLDHGLAVVNGQLGISRAEDSAVEMVLTPPPSTESDTDTDDVIGLARLALNRVETVTASMPGDEIATGFRVSVDFHP